jgi:hypothetical protein
MNHANKNSSIKLARQLFLFTLVFSVSLFSNPSRFIIKEWQLEMVRVMVEKHPKLPATINQMGINFWARQSSLYRAPMTIIVTGIAIDTAKITVITKEPHTMAHALVKYSTGLFESSLAFFSLFIRVSESYDGGMSADGALTAFSYNGGGAELACSILLDCITI